MPIKKQKKPNIINLSTKDFAGVESRVTTGQLTECDKKIILSVLGTYRWLYEQLQSARFRMQKLKNLFGFTTEKRSAKASTDNKNQNITIENPDEANHHISTNQNSETIPPKKQ
jgi:hypothetical protein